MVHIARLLAGVAVLINAASAAAAAEAVNNGEFALKDGDRVVFYGDSITEQRLYTTFVETFVATRYPNLDIAFFAKGVGGDATWGGWMGTIDERVSRDVKPCDPTVITIMLGMNDGGYVPFDEKILAAYQEWYGKLLALMTATAPNARITLIGASPYDDWAHPDTAFHGYNGTLLRFVDHVRTLAAENQLGFVDFNCPVAEFINKALAADMADAKKIIPDAIHPAPAGHLVMAAALLKAWNAEGVVSEVTVDAAASSVLQASHAQVRDLSALTWKQRDDALPFPTNPDLELALKYTDFSDVLNRQWLCVKGLEPGNHTLEIDGQPVATLSEEDWARGVNLALYDTPMKKQAAEVFQATVKRNEAAFTQWRNVEFALAGYQSTPDASAALGRLEREIRSQQREKSSPVERQYRILPDASASGA
ncbi:MAG: SGNH/GDSL hydrolase family protein [Candidatus Hydrogenedentes bacterium]|nr:SGNH/GDSL hydrolase family protein [Candidatus Hydrogenedentota bacterium]